MSETGGKLISIDLDAEKQYYAREQLKRAGLSEMTELITGDAPTVIANLIVPVDVALIDVWIDMYIPCFEAVWSKLASPAYLIADNMIHPSVSRSDAERYRAHVRAKVEQTILLPIGSGIEVSRVG